MSRIPNQGTNQTSFNDLLGGLLGCKKDTVVLTAIFITLKRYKAKSAKGKKMKGIVLEETMLKFPEVLSLWSHTGYI